MKTGIISYWNPRRGFGFTEDGVFVHVNVLCEHLYPGRDRSVPKGTEIRYHLSKNKSGEPRPSESAALAMCARCLEERFKCDKHVPTKRDFGHARRLLEDVVEMTTDPRILARVEAVSAVIMRAMRRDSPVAYDGGEDVGEMDADAAE